MNWLTDAKVGDTVILSEQNSNRILRIERETKTLFILSDKTRVNKVSGYSTGTSSFYSSYIKEGIPSELAKVRKNNRKLNIQRTLNGFNFSKLPSEDLERIYAIIEEFSNNV